MPAVDRDRARTTSSGMVHTLLPRERERRSQLTSLPADLLAQSARRLRVVALLYAFVFLMVNPLPAMLVAEERRLFLGEATRWAPTLVSILAALTVAALTRRSRFTGPAVIPLGLAFEVIGSYGIALAQYLDPSRYAMVAPWSGLSWVAVWMLSFTVMVPSPPRLALLAALLSATAVPVVTLVAVTDAATLPVAPLRFFLLVVLPYLLVVLISYIGARLIYRLGTDLKRALDIGAYRLMEPLGRGGMGEVWRARHRLLARPAAVKLIRPEVIDGSGVTRRTELHARFEREAQTTALLQSPHTIELYDFGVADDGTFYYVMELLDGFDLKTMVERFGPLSPARVVHLLLQVCHSLAEAHAAGLVHRDIKPANVFACRYGRDVDFVKVLDFGLVKSMQSDGQQQTGTEALRVAGGTPAFMSPEQAMAEKALDGRADLYSVGCLAYWLLTGQLVFTAPTPLATLLAHTRDVPVPPSQRTELPVPPALERLVLACLSKRPDDRPADAETLVAALQAVTLDDRWTADEARAWWDLHHPRRASGEVAGLGSGPKLPR